MTTENIKTHIMTELSTILAAVEFPTGTAITYAISMPFPLVDLHSRFATYEVLVTVLSQTEADQESAIHEDIIVVKNSSEIDYRSVHLIEVWTRDAELKDIVVAAIKAGLKTKIASVLGPELHTEWDEDKRNRTTKTWNLLAKEDDRANFPEYYHTVIEFEMHYRKSYDMDSRALHVYIGASAGSKTEVLQVESAQWSDSDPWLAIIIPAAYRLTDYQHIVPDKLLGRIQCNDFGSLKTALYDQAIDGSANKAIASDGKHNVISYFVITLADVEGASRTFTFTNARIGAITWPEFRMNANDPEPAIVEFLADSVAIS